MTYKQICRGGIHSANYCRRSSTFIGPPNSNKAEKILHVHANGQQVISQHLNPHFRILGPPCDISSVKLALLTYLLTSILRSHDDFYCNVVIQAGRGYCLQQPLCMPSDMHVLIQRGLQRNIQQRATIHKAVEALKELAQDWAYGDHGGDDSIYSE